MAMRFFRHMLSQISMGGNLDRVLAHMSLPSECSQNNVWGDVHVINNDGFFIESAMVYGADGFVVPLPDPDTADSVDDIWDRLIEKEANPSSGVLDLDTTAVQGGPHFEAGETNQGLIADMHTYDDDNHWYKRRKIISFANAPTGFHWVTSGVSTFSPTDHFKVRSRKKISAELHSMSLLGFTIPGLAGTSSGIENTPSSEAKWLQQKYLEVVLEQAWMFLVGLVETGAETPWEDAANFVDSLLEPVPFEDSAGAWLTDTMRIFSQFTFDVTVPGRREFNILTGG